MALTKAMQVKVVTNGLGVPVTVVTNGRGVPCTKILVAGAFALPVIEVASGGLPIQYTP